MVRSDRRRHGMHFASSQIVNMTIYFQAAAVIQIPPILQFRRAVGMVQFLLRLKNMKDLKRQVDRIALGKRPFRDRSVC